MDHNAPFPCIMVRRNDAGEISFGVAETTIDQLPPGGVIVDVAYSSLNYKDALACQGHRGIVKQLPHIPGIDCAGRVAESASPDFQPSDPVLVTGYGLGAEAWGGYSRYVRVPAEWIVRLPPDLTPDEAMAYGTAGFTAAQCVMAIQKHGITPDHGEVVVTGATGGVGSVSVAILAKLGYRVAAVTGKPDAADTLQSLGATRIIGREEVNDQSDRPLLSSQWAAAVDTVGGNILATLLRSTIYRGCVTACGLVAGDQLAMTVHPFLLRGVALFGIDSAKCPRPQREEVWRRLGGDWKVDLTAIRREVTLTELPAEVEKMLAGQSFGRVIVRPST